MKTLIIIPAYNEAASIPGVMEHLRRTCPQYDYVIVNDGSTDGTAELCMKNGYHAIHHEVNRGLASAFRTGMKYALENGYDAALQFDADGQHLPEYIDGMIACMEKTGCDIVIASRFYDEKMPFRMRTVGGKMISAAIRRTTNKVLTDPTSGMRLYKRNMIRVFAENEHLTPEPDTLAFLIRMGADIREMQVKMEERKHGQSYLSPVNASKYMLRILTSILFLQRKWEKIDVRTHEEKTRELVTADGGNR
ncbi:MAG: glycosyltransferase family 2 protein [Eubacteriales bacterium]